MKQTSRLLVISLLSLSSTLLIQSMGQIKELKKSFNVIVEKIRKHKQLTSDEKKFVKLDPNFDTGNGWSYLHYGVQATNEKFVVDLLMNTKADVTKTTDTDQNVVHLAAYGANPYFVTLFIKRQWGVTFDLTKKDKMGYTPLEWAQQFKKQKEGELKNGTKVDELKKEILRYARCIKKLEKLTKKTYGKNKK